LDETREELGTVQAQPLALNATTRRWEPTGATFEASVLDYSGRETYALGQTLDTELMRMFSDFAADGALPVSVKARVRVEGKDWHVLGSKRIPGDDPGAVYDLSRAT
jgi:hypothetical protein